MKLLGIGGNGKLSAGSHGRPNAIVSYRINLTQLQKLRFQIKYIILLKITFQVLQL